MLPTRLSRRSIFVLSGLIASIPHVSAQAQTFLPGPRSGAAEFASPRSTISDAGQAVGTVASGGVSRATLWDAGTLSGAAYPAGAFNNTFGTVVSDGGTVVGYGTITGGSRALRWSDPTTLTVLDTLTPAFTTGAVNARANAINASGLTVGYSEIYDAGTDDSLGSRAVYWSPGSMAAAALAFQTNSSGVGSAQARAVSNSGWIAGDGLVYDDDDVAKGSRGALWTSSGTLSLTLNAVSLNAVGDGFVQVTGVNDAGTVVGNSRMYSGSTDLGLRAVRWETGSATPTLLGTLGALPSGANVNTTTIAVDPFGNVAGLSQKYVDGVAKGTRPVLWRAGETTPLELQILGTDDVGATRGNMSAMNSFGFIAGTMQSYNPDHSNIGRQAVVWDLTGAIYNLNDYISGNPAYAGWFLTIATDITDTGWVSGVGTFDPDPLNGSTADAYERYFSLQSPTFIPEPTSAVLLLSGLAAAAGFARRRRVVSRA